MPACVRLVRSPLLWTTDSRGIITPLHGYGASLALSSAPSLSPALAPTLGGGALSPFFLFPPVSPPLEVFPSPRSASSRRSGVRVLLRIPERLWVPARQSMHTGLGSA